MAENWKIVKHKSCVVSDVKQINTNFPNPPNPETSEDSDIEYYGGYLVCESIGNDKTAKLITAAPELLEAAINAIRIVDLWAPNYSEKQIKECEIGELAALSIMRQSLELAIKKATE
jgi:hypothetical protein